MSKLTTWEKDLINAYDVLLRQGVAIGKQLEQWNRFGKAANKRGNFFQWLYWPSLGLAIFTNLTAAWMLLFSAYTILGINLLWLTYVSIKLRKGIIKFQEIDAAIKSYRSQLSPSILAQIEGNQSHEQVNDSYRKTKGD